MLSMQLDSLVHALKTLHHIFQNLLPSNTMPRLIMAVFSSQTGSKYSCRGTALQCSSWVLPKFIQQIFTSVCHVPLLSSSVTGPLVSCLSPQIYSVLRRLVWDRIDGQCMSLLSSLVKHIWEDPKVCICEKTLQSVQRN